MASCQICHTSGANMKTCEAEENGDALPKSLAM